MSFSNSVVPARAITLSANDTERPPRRIFPLVHRALLASVASALTVGLLMAGAFPAQAVTPSAGPQSGLSSAVSTAAISLTPAKPAAQPKITKSKVKVSTNKKSYVKGQKGTKLQIKASVAGKKVSGTAKIYDGKKKLRTIKVHKGHASYTLPKNLSATKHTITVRFIPADATKNNIQSSSAKVQVRVVSRGDHVATVAKKYVGVKYRSGGKSPRGFDCSGFTSYVYKEAGVKTLPTSSSAQRHVGKVVSRSKAKPGDLIWTPGHVAIYLGGNKQIDAPRPGKTVQVRNIWQSNPKFIRV